MNEILRIENVLKILRRGQFTLTGEEALAFSQSYQWLIEKKEQLSRAAQEKPTEVKTLDMGRPPALPVSSKGKK